MGWSITLYKYSSELHFFETQLTETRRQKGKFLAGSKILSHGWVSQWVI